MAQIREPLLNKAVLYYDNCPGCKVDRKKETQLGVPFKELLFMGIIVLSNALPISSLFPFLYFMVRDFHVAKREEDIEYYAGYIGASYMFGRFLTSVFWGMAADRYGRKPVIMIGTGSVVILNLIFGLSTSFLMAISTRFFLGLFNGSLGPVRAYASEVCRPEYQALGLSVVGTFWGIGPIVGPAIGGFLAQPAENYPHIIPADSLFGRFPYLLPCLVISFFALVVLIGCLWLPESLHMHQMPKIQDDTFETTESSYDHDNKLQNVNIEGLYSKKSLLQNWPLISSIIVYCAFSLQDMAYTEIFSLWAVSARKYGSLGFSTREVGEVLSVSGLGMLLFQLFIFPWIERFFGPIMIVRASVLITVPLIVSYPLIAKLSGFSLSFAINCASLLKNMFSVGKVVFRVVLSIVAFHLFLDLRLTLAQVEVTVITGLFIMQNNSVPQHQRGAANGISMCGMSFFKAIGPAMGGSLFAWAQEQQNVPLLPGDSMVFSTLSLMLLIVVLMTFKPFLMKSLEKPYQGEEKEDQI